MVQNPLIIEEPFWNRERSVSGVVTLAGVLIVALVVGGESALDLTLAASGHIVCLWAPYAVAHFPVAGAAFLGRPLSHESFEESVIIIGWLYLVCWVFYATFVIVESL